MSENSLAVKDTDCLTYMETPAVSSGSLSQQPQEESLPPLPASPEESGISLEDESNMAPHWPVYPETSFSYGEVRFLIAASTPFPLTISIDDMIYADNAVFGTIGNYMPVSDGFHHVSVYYTFGPKIMLMEKIFPFRAGEAVTMVVLDSEASGISISQISDTACRNFVPGFGCFRVANMSFAGSLYDILLQTGEPVFRDIAFNTVTSYKQAEAGCWPFQVSSLTCSDTYQEIPSISLKTTVSSCLWITPVLTFEACIGSGRSYTSYLIGSPWSDRGLQVLTTEDGSAASIQSLPSKIPL